MKLKKLIAMVLVAAMMMCVMPLTALAAVIDFDTGGVTKNDGTADGNLNDSLSGNTWENDGNNNITLTDDENTVSGNGTGYILFINGDSTLLVDDSATVDGLWADGDLTIDSAVPDGGGALTVTQKGTVVVGDLLIDGGVTVDSTNNDQSSPGVYAEGGIYIADGTLKGTGGEANNEGSYGIRADGNVILVGEEEYTQDEFDARYSGNYKSTTGKGTATVNSGGTDLGEPANPGTATPGGNNSNNNDNYGITTSIITLTDSQIDAMERLAKLFDAYDKAYRAWEDAGAGNANRPALLSSMVDALNKLLDAFLELDGDADMLAALSGNFNASLSAYRKDESIISENGRKTWHAGGAHLLDPRLDLNSDAYNKNRQKAQETANQNIANHQDGYTAYYAAGNAYDAIIALRNLLSMFGYWPLPKA